jgi:hypothetical protein
VAPRGTALLGPFPPSRAGSTASLRIASEHGVYARAVCRSHAGALIDADRRGDPVRTDDWSAVAGAWRPTFGAMPCTWMLALRSTDAVAVAEVDDVHVDPADPALEAPDRWVSIDDVEVVEGELDADAGLAIESDRWRATALPRKRPGLPAVTILAPDESLWVRVRGRDGAVVAEAVLPREGPTTVDLTASNGTHLCTVNVHVRVRSRFRDP